MACRDAAAALQQTGPSLREPPPALEAAFLLIAESPGAWGLDPAPLVAAARQNQGGTHDSPGARQQPTDRPHERRASARRDAAPRRGRADVRDGRFSAPAVLRRAGAARDAAFSDQ